MNKTTYINNLHYNLALFGSNFDIMHALNCGDDKIIKYSELKNYKSLQELLPSSFDFKIILLETDRNTGHWTCVIRQNNIVECFNSYGIAIDKEFNYIPNFVEKMLGENKRYLSMLINTTNPFTVISNKYKFQSQNPDVATCARWCILRIETARIGYSLNDFVRMIHNQTEKTNLPTDILVLNYVHFKDDKPLG